MAVQGRIVVSEIYCKGCELCVAVCPPQVMGLDLERLSVKGYHPVKLLGPGCTGCGVCALVCPESALTVYRKKVEVAA
ncbi:MAG TPA: 4Fe-4S dicluster domain-containing protein [Anaerolineaceae bacterium]